ncbi:FAD-dependent monooxygenase [Amycolatopsis alkalitolerans]|uniref:FAD-dependent oxidoreductase n=1 Tax=Amycolatopsis alkalitolerans TaxID=2547244 RepID=A0A5C4LZ88_9PSEU|nr:FAD-dependent monooxygenase [Amycolatopsis alkalitolerans]TNC24380.1 FAD-dependent oxidoreductase [Amycolatopsis alkalitolerans]
MNPEVVIAGAGPNGLFLACELRRTGVKPLVLERLPEPATQPKANGLVGRVVQLLDYRGLYHRLSGLDGAPRPAPAYQFAGFGLDLRGVGEHPLYTLPLPQRVLEARLTEYALELGIEIRRGSEVVSVDRDEAGVTLEVEGAQGRQRIRTGYLVGADGAHSIVRKQAGIGFPGTTDNRFLTRSGRVLIPDPAFVPGTGEIDVPGEGRLRPFRWNRTPRGVIAFARFGPGPFLLSTAEWDQPGTGEEPLTLDELRAAVRRVAGRDVPMDAAPDFAGRRNIGTNARQADRYREGRVLLLGDAAHVHPSFGGPGLNLGLQDAANLGWKLAATIQGRASEGLLDTYESERHPVGRRVLSHTRAQVTLLSPGEDVGPLRELFGSLLDEDAVRRRIADLLAGADVRYDMAPAEPRPLLGRWMPDLPLRPGTRVGELTRAGRPVLVDFTGEVPPEYEPVRATTPEPPAPAVLIRPDGYVAWAGGRGLDEALRKWAA